MRRSDVLLLVGFTALVFSVPLALDRTLGNHETVHCQNIREMRSDGDWVIPHYGGRPWLERPPLPFWLTMPLVSALGDHSRVYRLASVLVGLVTVLCTGWIATTLFGRTVGLVSGCITATLHEFTRYAIAPEADIFVCSLVAIGMTIFVHLEFQRRPDERGSFIGARPWAVLTLFVVLGLGNLVKGLFFTDLLMLVPISLFLLLSPKRWTLVRRYIWLPGWLVFVAVALSWAGSAYLRQPDIVALWESDYLGRLHGGYMREPWWYYLAHLPLNLAPWTPIAFLGLWLTREKAWQDSRSPERLVWLWAVAPVLVLSIPRGKHHHYLLALCAPWAMLAALGAIRLHEWLQQQVWLRRPYVALAVIIVSLELVIWVVGQAVPKVTPWVPALLASMPVVVVVGWLACTQQDPQMSLALSLGLATAVFWARELVDWHAPGPGGDRAFVARTCDTVPGDQPVLVLDQWGPLDASWSLYYFEGRAQLLHNDSFLRTIAEREVFVVTRVNQVPLLRRHGRLETVFTSEVSRNEKTPGDRLTLIKVTRPDAEVRQTRRVYISPMQATGRAQGPIVE